jgi:tRNA(fMet)-specific endonuclease VapC
VHLLDSNTISHMIRHPEGVVSRRIGRSPDVATSIIVAAELRYGAELKRSPELTKRVRRALELIPVFPFMEDADARYAALRADLRRRGRPIGANDLLIAAHALALDATLVTDNVREFERVDGLRVENWLRDGAPGA